jgi:hypothetical protein
LPAVRIWNENKEHKRKIAESMSGKSCAVPTFAPTKYKK